MNGTAHPAPAVELEGQETLGALLRGAHQAATRAYRRMLEPLGLTPLQASVIGALLQRSGVSLCDLAERVRADAATLCGVIDALVTAGLVERRESASDRRKTLLFATGRAAELAETLQRATQAREQALLSRLSAEEAHLLQRLLRRLCTVEQPVR